jgi:putrescine transport system permease protein
MLVILPFWTSFLLRVYAWIGILKNNGMINNILMGLGIIDEPIVMMQTDFAVYIGIVYSYLPFMILPLYANLERLDLTLLEAAADLGCPPAKVFFYITLPIIAPALVSGWLLAFTLSLDDLVIASFVSGPGSSTLPMVIFSKVRLGVSPEINALATIIVLIVALGIIAAGIVMNRAEKRRQRDVQMAIAANQ